MADLICKRCGLKVTRWLDGYKHASGWRNGKTPKSKRHAPEPIAEPVDDSAQVIKMLRTRRK